MNNTIEKALEICKTIHFAVDFDGKDSLNKCDFCGEPYSMSELTTHHREDVADLFICGDCLLRMVSNPKE